MEFFLRPKRLFIKSRLAAALVRSKTLAWAAAFAVPALGYLLLWYWLGADAVTRLGYALYAHDWPINEGTNCYFRIVIIKVSLAYFVPFFAGLAGLGWRGIFLIRRERVEGVRAGFSRASS